MLTKDLLAQFNIVARTEYNRAYQEFEPKFQGLLFEYESGPVETVNFPFFGFLTGMEAFTGSRKHQTFPDGYNFTVTNKEWDMSVDIPRKDLDRAANINSLQGLNPYTQRISQMPIMAKDHPVELAFDMLEAGDSSTYGTSFDMQNFFSTTHSYGTVAGSQSNTITNGSGISVVNLLTDFLRCLSAFQGMTYQQGGDTKTSHQRKLNATMENLLVVCPTQLYGTFWQLKTIDRLPDNSSNPIVNSFDLVSLPFADVNDWYMIILDNATFKPFLYQVEKPVELDMPTMQDEGARERKIFTYGAYGRYNIAYGAWWTAMFVQNSG